MTSYSVEAWASWFVILKLITMSHYYDVMLRRKSRLQCGED